MPRLAAVTCIVLAAALSSAASAAGPVGAWGGSAPRSVAGPPLRAMSHVHAAKPWRVVGHPAQGRWRHHRRAGVLAFGDPWPWYDPGVPFGGLTIVERQAEAPPVDPDAFANLRARSGIRPAPTPQPALYRLEGPRERPVTKIIPIAGSEPARPNGRSGHVETGALLLTVPSR